MRIIRVLIAPLCLALGQGAAFGQKVPLLPLPPAEAKLEAEFTSITSVRELSDGRVIITDPRDRGLVVADLRTGRVEEIGRKGQGPGEYGAVGPVRALASDSSLMIDRLSRRWLLLDGQTIVATIPADAPVITATEGFGTGADANGFVLTFKSPPARPGASQTGKADSTTVVLVWRSTGHADTIARLRRAVTRVETAVDGGAKTKNVRVYRHPLSVGEEALLFTDGWLAVARLEPYRVEWRTPMGRWVRGAALPVPLMKLDDREKGAFMQRVAKSTGDPVESPDVLVDWPESIPPFAANMMVGSADGRLLLRHEKTADHLETIYDVVNRHGTLEKQLTLPENAWIVGFGATSVYVVVRDENDVQRLQRHPWRAGPPITP